MTNIMKHQIAEKKFYHMEIEIFSTRRLKESSFSARKDQCAIERNRENGEFNLESLLELEA